MKIQSAAAIPVPKGSKILLIQGDASFYMVDEYAREVAEMLRLSGGEPIAIPLPAGWTARWLEAEAVG